MAAEKNEKYMQALFGLMGKAVHIERESGEATEGIVRGVFLEGTELITISGVVSVPFAEIRQVQAFGVPIEVQETPGKSEETAEEPADGDVLLAEITNGTKESLVEKLSRPAFYTRAGLTEAEAAELRGRVIRSPYIWNDTPQSLALRYRGLLKELARPEVLITMYKRAIEEDSGKNMALLELLRLYVKREQYEEAITLFRRHAQELGNTAYEPMQCYATALGHVEGAAALENYLTKNPGLWSFSTNRPYFDKLLKTLREEGGRRMLEFLEGDEVFPAPNAFEEAVLSGNLHRARQLAANETEMRNMGYMNAAKMESILRELTLDEMARMAAWQRAKVLLRLEENRDRNRAAERTLLEDSEECGARATLLLLYAREKEYKKVLSLYKSIETPGFNQHCAAFAAYDALEEYNLAAALLEEKPEIFADGEVRKRILAALPATYTETAEKIAKAISEKATPMEGSDAFEKALIAGDSAEIERLAESREVLTEGGYTKEEIGKIKAAAKTTFTTLCGDAAAGARLAHFLGGRGLLALRYFCKEVSAQNVGEILSLMEASGLGLWGEKLFEARRADCSGNSTACAAYASMLLASRPAGEALEKIAPLAEVIYDRALLDRILAACRETGDAALIGEVEKILNTYRPNDFEQAVINGIGFQEMAQDGETLLALGYTEEEVSHIVRVLSTAPKGTERADIGRRLHHLQGNKNGLAEWYLAPYATSSDKTARVMFTIYSQAARYEELLALYDAVPSFFANQRGFCFYLDALYFTGNGERFLEEYHKGAYQKVKRHAPMCAYFLATAADPRLPEILETLDYTYFTAAETEIWTALFAALTESTWYAESARLLCRLFAEAAKGGRYATLLPLLDAAAPTEEDKIRMIDYAAAQGLDMSLPFWWIKQGTPHHLSALAEGWYAEKMELLRTETDINGSTYLFIEALFPEKKTEITVEKFSRFLTGGESYAGAVWVLESLLAEMEYESIKQLLPLLGDKAGAEPILAVLEKMYMDGILCKEVVTALCKGLFSDEEGRIFRFFAENVSFAKYAGAFDRETLQSIKENYMRYVVENFAEKPAVALYDFLYDTEDADAPILAAFLMRNNRLWDSAQSRGKFESLCSRRGAGLSGTVLTDVFTEVLTSDDPEKVRDFLQKWYPFSNKRTDLALKALSRSRREDGEAEYVGSTEEVVCSMAAAWESSAAWRRLLELYKHKGVKTEGNILYSIAKCDGDVRDIKQAQNFAQLHALPILSIYASLLSLRGEQREAKALQGACGFIRMMAEKCVLSQTSMQFIQKTLLHAAEQHPAAVQEIMRTARSVALSGGAARVYTETFSDYLLQEPTELLALVLDIYTYYPEEAEVGAEMRAQAESGAIPASPTKDFVLAVTEEPERLLEPGAARRAAQALLPTGEMLNVAKMYEFILSAITSPEEGALEAAIGAAQLLLRHFPEEGLLDESRYYLFCAEGKAAEKAAEIYEALFGYLSKTTMTDDLFVHYVKRMYCGLRFLACRPMPVMEAPTSTEALMAFFESRNTEEALHVELRELIRLTAMLEGNDTLFESLMLCGFTGDWRPFLGSFSSWGITSLELENMDAFIESTGGKGRFNFRRSLADMIAAGKEWEGVRCLLTEEEQLQMEAIAAVTYGEKERNAIARFTRYTMLDKASALVMADKIFAQVTQEEFGMYLPVLRVLLLDGATGDKLRRMPNGFLEAAAKTVMQQKDTVPMQILSKDYRDFVRLLANLLFDRGLYEEAYPIFGLLFETDSKAAQYSGEGAYNNKTHAVCRQRQKFCGMIFGEPETVQKFQTTTEYGKLINFFAVHFGSKRISDLAQIAPLMTALQKKLCAAVFFLLRDAFSDFERLAADIRAENVSMGEMLFRYGEWFYKDNAERKARCRRYLPERRETSEEGEEGQIFFLRLKPEKEIQRIRIFDLLKLGQEGELEGQQVFTAKKTTRDFLSYSFVQYALSAVAETGTPLSRQEAMTRFDTLPNLRTGAQVLRAMDIDSADKAELEQFLIQLGLIVYEAVRETGKERQYIPDLFACMTQTSALPPVTANKACRVMKDIIRGISDAGQLKLYFYETAGHFISLLSAADTPEAMEDKKGVEQYLTAARRLLFSRDVLDKEKDLSIMEKHRAECLSAIKRQGDTLSAELLGNLAFVIEKEISEQKKVPLFRLKLDSLTLCEGMQLTGYVENIGSVAAKDAVLTLSRTDGEAKSISLRMRRLFGEYKAPFAFPLGGKAGEEISFNMRISYTYDGAPMAENEEGVLIKSWTSKVVKIEERKSYALNQLPERAVKVEKMQDFIGREAEVQSIENEFYAQRMDENGKVQRILRPVDEVPTMLVNGPKRVGKSSLLHRTEKMVLEMPEKWVCVYADPMGNASLWDIFIGAFQEGWAEQYGSVADTETYREILARIPKDGFSLPEMAAYYKAFRDAFAPGKKIFYIIDEIEVVMNVSSREMLFNILQYAMKNLNDVIGFMVCGSDDWSGVMFDMENDTQFFQIVRTFQIGRMPSHEYQALLKAFSERTGLMPDAAAREGLWLLTRGQIYYTQCVFNKLVTKFGDLPLCGTQRDMRLYDVYWAFAEQGNMFRGLDTMFKKYTTGEHEVIMAMGQYCVAPGDGVSRSQIEAEANVPDIEKALERLEKRGFIEFDGREYKFTSEMYRVVFGKYAPAALYFRR